MRGGEKTWRSGQDRGRWRSRPVEGPVGVCKGVPHRLGSARRYDRSGGQSMPNLTKPGTNPTPGGAVTSDNTLDDASPVRGATVQLTEALAPQHLRGVQAAQQADGLRWAIRIRFAAANVVGGMLVWVYLRFLFPWNDAGRPRDDALNERVFLAYLIVVTLIAFLIQNVLMNLAVRWAERGRLPGRFRRGLVLRLALTLSVQNYLWWALAGLIFAWLNHSPRVGIGIAVVGLVTSTSIYLLLDRPIRPLIDLAQAGQVLGRRQRDVERRIWLFWLLGSGLPLLAVGLALLTSPTGRAMPHWRLAALLGAGLGAGGAVMWGAASSTGRRIERVRRDGRGGRGQLRCAGTPRRRRRPGTPGGRLQLDDRGPGGTSRAPRPVRTSRRP